MASLTLAGALTAFMFQYLHPVYENVVSVGHAQDLRGEFTAYQLVDVRRLGVEAGVPGFMLATAFLFGPVLLLLRRWRLPRGAALVVLGVQCLLLQALTGFADPGLALLGLVGAVAVELAAGLLRPSPAGGARLRAFCALAPVAFWGVYLGGVGLHDGGLGWTAEEWGGALVWSALSLLALALLAFPPAVPGRPADA